MIWNVYVCLDHTGGDFVLRVTAFFVCMFKDFVYVLCVSFLQFFIFNCEKIVLYIVVIWFQPKSSKTEHTISLWDGVMLTCGTRGCYDLSNFLTTSALCKVKPNYQLFFLFQILYFFCYYKYVYFLDVFVTPYHPHILLLNIWLIFYVLLIYKVCSITPLLLSREKVTIKGMCLSLWMCFANLFFDFLSCAVL